MSPYARHCGVVDVQMHFVPKTLPRYAGTAARARWPSMVPAADCHRHVMLDDELAALGMPGERIESLEAADTALQRLRRGDVRRN